MIQKAVLYGWSKQIKLISLYPLFPKRYALFCVHTNNIVTSKMAQLREKREWTELSSYLSLLLVIQLKGSCEESSLLIRKLWDWFGKVVADLKHRQRPHSWIRGIGGKPNSDPCSSVSSVHQFCKLSVLWVWNDKGQPLDYFSGRYHRPTVCQMVL